MTSLAMTALERALQRYGDDLYRLALLLTPDPAHAEAALLAAVRSLAVAPPTTIDEPALLAALLAALPPERRGWWPSRLPAWARRPTEHADLAHTLAALARLPRRELLALGLTMLRGFEPEQAAALLGGDETHVRGLVRDALLSLAPDVLPDTPPADLESANAPPDCQPTRVALGLGGPALHMNPAIRGHLALCPSCRDIEQKWQHLGTTVENALRGALRDIRPPGTLAARLQAAASPEQTLPAHGRLTGTRMQIGLVAGIVLLLVVALVLPRRDNASEASGNRTAAGASVAPHDLVQRAYDQLYAPPPGNGLWHGRWEIRWNFADGAFAMLNGEQWIDPDSTRHRIQLVHNQGGGPYEFELADGVGQVWYGLSPSYGSSLYPLLLDEANLRVRIPLNTTDQARMLQARRQSGAWDLAGTYLRQARAAGDLRTWGRQRAEDGTLLDLISLRGFSPLALPADAPNATTSEVTILLAIDGSTGTLREVRELVGAEGDEQTGRVTWRFLGGEWLTGGAAASSLDLRQAWNGTGTFVERPTIVDPALPMVTASATRPLAYGLDCIASDQWIPARPPEGASRALSIENSGTNLRCEHNPTLVYLGEGRRLVIRTDQSFDNIGLPSRGGERIDVNSYEATLLPITTRGYQAEIRHQQPFSDATVVTHISAFGYSRAELLALLRTLGPPALAGYTAQAHLFGDERGHDPAAFDALLAALKPRAPAPPGLTYHSIEHTFKRHNPAPEPQLDPYHLPRYGGRPELLTQDNWSHGSVMSGTLVSTTRIQDAAGTVYTQAYLSPTDTWFYDGPTSRVNYTNWDQLALGNIIDSDQGVILRMIACGGTRLLALPDGGKLISLSEADWIHQDTACQHPSYPDILRDQLADETLRISQREPYLTDLQDRPLTTWLTLRADGRPTRWEVRAGEARDSELIEAWELSSEEQVPNDQVPPQAMDPQPPPARNVWQNVLQPILLPEPSRVTISATLDLAQTALFVLGPEAPAQLMHIEAGPSAIEARQPGFTPLPGPLMIDNPDDPFDSALRRGSALRFSYALTNTSGLQLVRLYEGPARELGGFLRALAQWRSSVGLQVIVAGRTINAWQVTTYANGLPWTIFEIDGTLIALEHPVPDSLESLALLEHLQPLSERVNR